MSYRDAEAALRERAEQLEREVARLGGRRQGLELSLAELRDRRTAAVANAPKRGGAKALGLVLGFVGGGALLAAVLLVPASAVYFGVESLVPREVEIQGSVQASTIPGLFPGQYCTVTLTPVHERCHARVVCGAGDLFHDTVECQPAGTRDELEAWTQHDDVGFAASQRLDRAVVRRSDGVARISLVWPPES